MLKLILFSYLKLKVFVLKPIWYIRTKLLLITFNVEHDKFISKGVPKIFVNRKGSFKIGKNFSMNNDFSANIIGRQQPCIFIVNNGKLTFGDNVGVSSLAIVCHDEIIIEDNVKIGGNTVIYDTDFHSLDFKERNKIPEIKKNVKRKKIEIEKNVFIGGHCTILKGVKIGENSIIGAGSVVSVNIPSNQIWAGNPVKFIRKISNESK